MAVAIATQKEVIARSRVIYRGVIILETKYGCEFFIGLTRYLKPNLEKATAFIDEKLGGNRVS